MSETECTPNAMKETTDSLPAGEEFICLRCEHRFSADEAVFEPDKISFYGFIIIGSVVSLMGLLGVWSQFHLWAQFHLKMISWEVLIRAGALFFVGVGLIYHGFSYRKKGQYATCPSCGERGGVPVDSPDGQFFIKNVGKPKGRLAKESLFRILKMLAIGLGAIIGLFFLLITVLSFI